MPLSTARVVVSRLDAVGLQRQRLTVDSRNVRPGDVFVALPGTRVDGRQFIAMAKANGAAAVLCETSNALSVDVGIPIVEVSNLASNLGVIADTYYGEPSAHLRVLGITGTNGKTSIANWLSRALTSLGEPCAAIGTLGVSFAEKTWLTQNTTPDAASVHTILRDLRLARAKAVAMEVSSHALELGRVAGVRFDTVIFTNLTQDHLDFHGTMAAYGAAKARLFKDYPTNHRIINADDEFGAQLISQALPNTLSYGLGAGDVRGQVLTMDAAGMRLLIAHAGESAAVATKLIGRFNASNLLAVAATLLASGTALDRVAEILSEVISAPGRMQRVNAELAANEPSVYVDYAHTPDALAKALDTVRETRPASLAVVFGCGGDRDRSKRPLMGQIAVRRADHVYITSDNPRTEPPDQIIAEIVAGIDRPAPASVAVMVNRRDAITAAISRAASGDAILIAGKGHETYQEILGVRHPFDDAAEAALALAMRNPLAEVHHVG